MIPTLYLVIAFVLGAYFGYVFCGLLSTTSGQTKEVTLEHSYIKLTKIYIVSADAVDKLKDMEFTEDDLVEFIYDEDADSIPPLIIDDIDSIED